MLSATNFQFASWSATEGTPYVALLTEPPLMSITVAAIVICLEVTPTAVPWGHFVTAAFVATAAPFTWAGWAVVAGAAQLPAISRMLVARISVAAPCRAT